MESKQLHTNILEGQRLQSRFAPSSDQWERISVKLNVLFREMNRRKLSGDTYAQTAQAL